MFNHLEPQSEDAIIRLMKMFRDDPRPDKIDLGVGVYKDASANTPIMKAVKSAEQALWQRETTKTYTALAGDPAFHDAMISLVLGPTLPRERIAAIATPGGTGAVHHALDLVRMARPGATIWVSDPTWPNHLSIIDHLGLKRATYRYFDAETRAVNFTAMAKDLGRIQAGDVVLLHGCCHNPTGANLNAAQMAEVADLLLRTGALALIDLAYQGFGDGLEEDAGATRMLAQKLPETLIAASCSKNFGIYRERTGILLASAPDAKTRALVQGNLTHLNRQSYSFPPDHGARLVTMILNDAELRAAWQGELRQMRLGMLATRQRLAGELQRLSGSDRFGFLAAHRGMFSRLGATPAQVETLRREHGIYLVGDSRMNIAGLTEKSLPVLARAIIDTGI